MRTVETLGGWVRRGRFAGILALAGLCACSTLPRHPRQLRFEPLKFDRPKPVRTVLKNGMVIFTLENHELPLVSAHFKIRTGALLEPADKAGLAGLTGKVLRTGGTTTRKAEEIDQRLEFLAASIESSIARQEGTVDVQCLSKDFDEVLDLLNDILRRPQFAEDKLDLAKRQLMESIRRENDDPDTIVAREFDKLLYASSPAWGRRPDLETVGRISRNDLLAFHARYFHPNNIIAGFAGDFDTQTLIAALERLFGDWPKGDLDFPPIPPLAERNEPSVNLVHKDQPQAYIQFGHLGIRRHNPDYYAVTVMNRILGSGIFTCRLGREVRSNRGLAYSVGSVLTDDTDRGRFMAWCQTKSESTTEAISVMQEIIQRMATDPISDDEMERSKAALRDSFIFRFETPQQIVTEQVRLAYYGYPEDFLDTYIDKINAVAKDDVLRAAKQYLHPDQMILVVVGNRADLKKPLEQFGKVNEIALKAYE